MASMAPISRGELTTHLQEQVHLLETACASFDSGDELQGLRIAVSLRTLLHTTASSTSLLKHLGEDNVLFCDGASKFDAAAPVEGSPGQAPTGAPGVTLMSNMPGLVAVGHWEDGRTAYVPSFIADGGLPDHWVAFHDWWTTPAMRDRLGVGFSRRRFVLMLANKGGGAHIDNYPAEVRALATSNSLGWERVDGLPFSPMFAAIRQIGEEVRRTLRVSLAADLVAALPAYVPVTEWAEGLAPALYFGSLSVSTWDE